MNQRVLERVGWSVLLVLGILPALLGLPNTDESWPLYLAERVLEGHRHGVDFFEINPPLYIWICIPAVLLSLLTGITAWQAWVVLVGCAGVLSLMLVARQLQRIENIPGRRSALLLAAGFVLLLLPRSFYSEREHLGLILTLPFLFIAAQRARRGEVARGDAITAGLMGGMGFSIKPHFLIVWLLVEVGLVAKTGRFAFRRAELWALIGFGMTYLLGVILLAPEYFTMVRRLAPLYHMYLNNGFAGVLSLAGPWLLLLIAIAGALRVAAPSTDELRNVLALAFLGFMVAALLQQKGLNYHFLTPWGFGFLMLVRAWQLRPASLSWYPSGLLVRAGGVMLAVILATKTLSAVRELVERLDPKNPEALEYSDLVHLTNELATGQPIIVLSTNPSDGWPLTLVAGARWASRYMHFWPMAAIHDRELWSLPPRIVKAPPLEQGPDAERRFIDEIMEDLSRHRPRLVLVLTPDITQWGSGGSRRFDYLEYFSVDPRFRRFMLEYRFLKQIGAYQVYLRGSPE